MSRIDQTLVLIRHQFATTYGGHGSDEFARNAATAVAMSVALDSVDDYVGEDGGPAQVRRAQASGIPIPDGLVEGLGRLGEMAGMPFLSEDYRDRAVEVFWRQMEAFAEHRASAEPALGPRV